MNKRPYENSSDVSACPPTKATGDSYWPWRLLLLVFRLPFSKVCGHTPVAKNVRNRNSQIIEFIYIIIRTHMWFTVSSKIIVNSKKDQNLISSILNSIVVRLRFRERRFNVAVMVIFFRVRIIFKRAEWSFSVWWNDRRHVSRILWSPLKLRKLFCFS